MTDGAYTLVVADFAALDDAYAAYESLKEADATLKILHEEGTAVAFSP